MKEIKTKDISPLRKKYLKDFGLSSLREATLSQANEFFVTVIHDFKNGKLSTDELSTFGFELFHGVAKKHPESDLFQASLSASELAFAIRSDAVYKNIPSYLTDIDNFYKANKTGAN